MEAVNIYVNRRGGRGFNSVKTVVMGWTDEDMKKAYADFLRDIADKLHPAEPSAVSGSDRAPPNQRKSQAG
jgi:hypothetical protein